MGVLSSVTGDFFVSEDAEVTQHAQIFILLWFSIQFKVAAPLARVPHSDHLRVAFRARCVGVARLRRHGRIRPKWSTSLVKTLEVTQRAKLFFRKVQNTWGRAASRVGRQNYVCF